MYLSTAPGLWMNRQVAVPSITSNSAVRGNTDDLGQEMPLQIEPLTDSWSVMSAIMSQHSLRILAG